MANDFRIIGRYLTGCTANGPKNLTREELSILFNQGLSVFAIYQDEKEYYNCHPDEETTVHYYNEDVWEELVDDAGRCPAAGVFRRLFYCPAKDVCICFRNLSAIGVKL